MAKEDLIPQSHRTKEEQKKIASMGGKASGKVRQQQKTFKDIFNLLLQDKAIGNDKLTNDQAMALQMIKEALTGNVKAFEVVRDTIGQKPNDKMEIGNIDDKPFEIKVNIVK